MRRNVSSYTTDELIWMLYHETEEAWIDEIYSEVSKRGGVVSLVNRWYSQALAVAGGA